MAPYDGSPPTQKTALVLGRRTVQFELRVLSDPRHDDAEDRAVRDVAILHQGAVITRRVVDARDVLLLNEILLDPRLLGLTIQDDENGDAVGLVFTVLDRDLAEQGQIHTDEHLQAHLEQGLATLSLKSDNQVPLVLGTVRIAECDRLHPDSRHKEALALYERILVGSVQLDIECLLRSLD